MLKSTGVIAPTIHSDVSLQCSATTERFVGAFFFEKFFGVFFLIFTGYKMNCVVSACFFLCNFSSIIEIENFENHLESHRGEFQLLQFIGWLWSTLLTGSEVIALKETAWV